MHVVHFILWSINISILQVLSRTHTQQFDCNKSDKITQTYQLIHEKEKKQINLEINHYAKENMFKAIVRLFLSTVTLEFLDKFYCNFEL